MDGKSFVAAPLFAVLSLAAGTAQAQLNPDSVLRQVSREVERSTGVELVEQGGNGHDKCKGNGHGGGSGGGGHEEGECEEDGAGEMPQGPVASEVCNVAVLSEESLWQRYACSGSTYYEAVASAEGASLQSDAEAVVAYGGEYTTGTVAAVQEYPNSLTSYVGTVPGTIDALVIDGTAILGYLGDGGNILDGGPIAPPLPRREELESSLIVGTDFSSIEAYVSNLSTYLGDGGNILDGGPIAPPLPRREEFTFSITDSSVSTSYGATSATISTSPITDYSNSVTDYTARYVDQALTGSSEDDGGNILDGGPIAPPLPRRDFSVSAGGP